MKNCRNTLFALLVAQTCLAQVTITVAGGSNYLPSHGSVGVTLGANLVGFPQSFTWYKRTNGVDAQIGTFFNVITVFVPGDYWVKETYLQPTTFVLTSSNSPITTIYPEAPTDMNTAVSTVMLHAGVKAEADLLAPYLGSHGLNSLTYLDGLGRTAQQVQCQASPTGLDIIQPVAYDNFGRVPKSYLPYTNGNTGNFHSAATTTEQAAFYAATGKKYANDLYPYMQTVYENSPAGTVLERGGTGATYQPNTVTPASGRTTKRDYRGNTASEVLMYTFNTTTTLASASTYYPAGTLSVTETTDPQGHVSHLYKDGSGKILMKKVTGDNATVQYNDRSTVYVYDDKERLVYEVPFSAINAGVGNNFLSTDAGCTNYMHYYQYDALDRPWYHRAPGAVETYTVYDRMDRPVMTQNGEQRKQNQWSFVKYDKMGRVVFTGLYTDNSSVPQTQLQMQSVMDSKTVLWESRQQSTTHGYSETNAFPWTSASTAPLGTATVMTVNYYDDYNFDFDQNNAPGTPDVAFYSGTDIGTSLPKPDYHVSGRATATKTATIGNASTGKWLWDVSFFDEMGRTIQVLSNSHVAAYSSSTPLNTLLTNSTTVWLDFVGKVLNSVEKHVNAAASISYIVKKRFVYDRVGRLLSEYQQNNSDNEVLVKSVNYNELGQVVEKNLGGTSTGGFLQSVDLTYDIQGRLAYINNPDLNNGLSSNLNNNDDINDRFGLKVLYDTQDADAPTTVPRYDGKASCVKWRTNNTEYGSSKDYMYYNYSYDNMGQYQIARYATRTATATTYSGSPAHSEWLTTDLDNNETSIERFNSAAAAMDNMRVSLYPNSNQVKSIIEYGDNTTGFVQNISVTGNAYVYNANGHLIQDLNKNITITYNYMDLVNTVTWNNPAGTPFGFVQYLYDANGTMLQKVAISLPNGYSTAIDYIDGFYYNNSILQYFNHSEGRVLKTATGLLYEYDIKDHQGNTRINFVDSNNDGVAEVTQETHYFPSGGKWDNSWSATAGTMDMFGMQGQESMTDGFNSVPLGWYDLGARMYDPAVVRFWAQDPLYQYDNPYVYCGNDPVNNYDPNGMFSLGDLAKSIVNPYYGLIVVTGTLDYLSEMDTKQWEVAAVIVVSVVATIVTYGAAAPEMGALDASIIAGAVGGAIAGAGVPALTGGTPQQILYGGLIGAFSGALMGALMPMGEAGEAAQGVKSVADKGAGDPGELLSGPGLGDPAPKAADPYPTLDPKRTGTVDDFVKKYNGFSKDKIITEEGVAKYSLFGKQPLGPNLRYLEDPLTKGKYIDMRHMLVIGERGQFEGLLTEIKQFLFRENSAFNKQDFFSNRLGERFYNNYYNPNSTEGFAEQIKSFLKNPDARTKMVTKW